MNKLSCPLCGCEHLQFVKSLKHTKRINIAHRFFLAVFVIADILSLLILFGAITHLNSVKSSKNIVENIEAEYLLHIVFGIAVIFLLSVIITVICIGFICNASYDINETTDYVCSCCGKHGNINEITSKEVTASNSDYEEYNLREKDFLFYNKDYFTENSQDTSDVTNATEPSENE